MLKINEIVRFIRCGPFSGGMMPLGSAQTKKRPRCFAQRGPYKIRHRPTLTPVTAIPSALAGLTALFGMGRGGHRRYRHLNTFMTWNRKKTVKNSKKATATLLKKASGY